MADGDARGLEEQAAAAAEVARELREGWRGSGGGWEEGLPRGRGVLPGGGRLQILVSWYPERHPLPRS